MSNISKDGTNNDSIYQFSADTLRGQNLNFSDYQNNVLLIVNTASKCGLTPQYEGLETLHQKYHDKGLSVVGFPCNQFAGQEPADANAIGEFCQLNYGVSFQMMAKVHVNGKDAHPLYQWLKNQKGGLLNDAIKWNFTKFLVDRNGKVYKRYASTTKPADIAKDIEQLLG